jgi:hypothetical protein
MPVVRIRRGVDLAVDHGPWNQPTGRSRKTVDAVASCLRGANPDPPKDTDVSFVSTLR